MLKLKKYTSGSDSDSPCYHCDLFLLCTKSIADDFSIKQEFLNQLNHPSMWSNDKEELKEILSFAIRCKKQYPNYLVKNERVTQHVLIGKGGKEIFRANSSWGLIGETFVTTILAFIALMIIALVVCGIGSLFE